MWFWILGVAFILAIFMTRKTKGIVTRFFSIIFYTVLFFFIIGFLLLTTGQI